MRCWRDTAVRSLRFLAIQCVLLILMPGAQAQEGPGYDFIIRGGTVYGGSGKAGVRADIGIRGDIIATVGDLAKATAKTTVDASGLAVAPGFINMLSWS